MDHYKKLFMSFVYAFKGIFRTIANERNLRIHLTCVIYMISILSLTDWFVLSRTDWAILVLCCGTVIGGEIVNTAIENAVNLASEEYTEYGKISKDASVMSWPFSPRRVFARWPSKLQTIRLAGEVLICTWPSSNHSSSISGPQEA